MPSYDDKNLVMNLNASLVERVLRSGEREALRVYLVAKTVAAGSGAWFRRDDPEFREKMKSALGISTDRTLDKKINKLLDLGWFYKCRKAIRIWNFGTLKDEFGVESNLCHLLRVRYVAQSKERFRATLLSIVVGKTVGQRRHSLVRNATHIEGASRRPKFDPRTGESYSPESLSLSFLAKRLGKSKATLHRWKRLANEFGLLSRLKNEYLFEGCKNKEAIQAAFPEQAYRVQYSSKKGCVKIQMADQLSSPLQFKCSKQ